MITVNFVTTNKLKFQVAQTFFARTGLESKFNLKQYAMETPEIQAETVEAVALNSARWVAKELQEPVVSADAGLFIQALGGFPGPYMKYVNKTLTAKDLLSLMKGKADRRVDFIDALGYVDLSRGIEKVFKSVTPGIIAKEEPDVEGQPIDQLFIPEGYELTLAEMSEEQRRRVWNTDRWQELSDYLISG